MNQFGPKALVLLDAASSPGKTQFQEPDLGWVPATKKAFFFSEMFKEL